MPSIPLFPGMTTSIRTTSGLCSMRLEDGALGVRRLADRLDVRLGVEHARRPGADDGVVVDDQDADASSQRHLGDERRPRAGRRLDREPPADERDALAHADEPEPVVRGRVRVEARAVVLDDRGDATPALRVSRMLTRARAGVLDDVRQRLLHDPVERRLDLARQPLVAELRLEVDRDARVCSRNVSARRSSAGDEPEVVERRRPQLDGEPADVLERRDDELAHGRDRGARLVGAGARSSGFRPSRIDVSACPVSSWSSRASRLRSSSCASTTRRTTSRLTRSERSTAIAARAASVSASRRSSSVKRRRRARACRAR